MDLMRSAALSKSRCRHGYFHVVNNDYTHWEMYVIGGSANPTINSQGNRYLAPTNRFAKEVRGLPCAHNFHVERIDEWLRLNVKCPRCRYFVFPNLDLGALSNFYADIGRPSTSVLTATHYVHTQPVG